MGSPCSHTLRSASAQYVAARNYAHVWNDFRQSQEDCALQPRVARNELPSIAIGKNLPFARRFSANRTLNIQHPTLNIERRASNAARCPGHWELDVGCSMFLFCSVAAPPRCVTSVCEEYVPNRHAVAVPLLFAVKDGFIQHAEVFNPGQSLLRAKS